MRWKIECSIQRGEAKLSRTFHFSPNENSCTIVRMKNIHYFFYITSKNICCHLEHLINIDVLENAILFWSRLKRLWLCQVLTREDAASSTGAILPTSLVCDGSMLLQLLYTLRSRDTIWYLSMLIIECYMMAASRHEYTYPGLSVFNNFSWISVISMFCTDGYHKSLVLHKERSECNSRAVN